MAKLETIFSVMAWGIMNVLLLAVAFDSALPIGEPSNAIPMHSARHAAAA